MKEMDVQIDGMTCGGCVRRVTGAFKKLEGIAKCDVEIGKAKVTYDEQKIDLERILDVVRQAGYSVKGELG
jgi:copper chaperone